MTRVLDIVFSFLALLVTWPLFLLIAVWIRFDSRGPVFFRQYRVGWRDTDFRIIKFRTMRLDSDHLGLLTVGGRDPRITRAGRFLRKNKLDELPQLINVLRGDMSLVGPRPEVRKYVDLYTQEQRKVLDIRPGITDVASIRYRHENELLATAEEPEELYVQVVMPDKIRLNMEYIQNPSVGRYLQITFETVFHLRHRHD
jgi:lipopolysaccharide/colanic/teichoic acid biosynthesis glycosyltransferase